MVKFLELEAVTKLEVTDAWYRKLAKAGYFPQPDRGDYDLNATVAGLLRYYRAAQTELTEHRTAIARETARAKMRDNDVKAGLLVERADAINDLRTVVQPIKDILYQKLENEYPAAVTAMDVPQARSYGRRLADEIFGHWQRLFSKWD